MALGIVGGGNIASAFISGLLKAGTPPEYLRVCEVCAATREKLSKAYPGVLVTAKTSQDWFEALSGVVLAVKPQILGQVVPDLVPFLEKKIVVSFAAGVGLEVIARLCQSSQVVRAMPNLPMSLGQGMTGLFAQDLAARVFAETLMQKVGKTVWLESDAQFDALTAISGSGPAYFFYVVDALMSAAQGMGFSQSVARQLAVQTAKGSADLLQARCDLPSELMQQVTSKGGTTEAALSAFEAGSIKDTLLHAVEKARLRSVYLQRAVDDSEENK